MALDHDLTLGGSGLRVSPLGLGTMTFGEDLGWGSMQAFFPAIHNGGTSVNGVQMPPSSFGLQGPDKPY
jgi:hypothetical protein